MIGNLADGSARLPVILAVDAMRWNPALAFQRGEGTNRVLGAVDTIEVSDQQIIEYSTSSREFENWAKNNSHRAITDTFAFLM
jgi:methyl coenzyme M reductase gamma subunit